MIDLSRLENYRENNRIEAKKSLGGFPQSVWETYSAFANTLGGIILLGVEEYRDKTLHPVNLPAPEKLVEEFWRVVNDRTKVSVNILSSDNIRIEECEGNRIILITVPRAERYDKPVYIGGNPLTGSYRRNGEGDYRCDKEEIEGMLRDAAAYSNDGIVFQDLSLDALCADSVKNYRTRMKSTRPGHIFEGLEDTEFLYRIGGAARDGSGKAHPTAAGLLMFGYEYEIVKKYPDYFLDYREKTGNEITFRLCSSSGEWSGNVYDFYFLLYNKVTRDITNAYGKDKIGRVVDTPVHTALREALANCLVNADYNGRQGVVIEKKSDEITFANPGGFRLDIERAKIGGVSDPRNAGLTKMFNLISVGDRTGSGIPAIFSAWQKLGLPPPEIDELFDPERTVFTLPLTKFLPKREQPHADDKWIRREAQKESILQYLTDSVQADFASLSAFLKLPESEMEKLLLEMVQGGVISEIADGDRKIYKLKQ